MFSAIRKLFVPEPEPEVCEIPKIMGLKVIENDNVRFAACFDREAYLHLANLTERSGNVSMENTIRHALAVFDRVTRSQVSKEQVIIRDKDGQETELLIV